MAALTIQPHGGITLSTAEESAQLSAATSTVRTSQGTIRKARGWSTEKCGEITTQISIACLTVIRSVRVHDPLTSAMIPERTRWGVPP